MDWTRYYDELNRYLHLRTWPVAIKYYKDGSGKPKGTIKPREPLNACQITSLARYYGRSLYFTAEDMACIIGAVTLGLYPVPEHIKNGEIASLLHKTKEGAKNFVDSVSMIPYGEVKGICVAPIHQKKVTFEPDQFLMYINTAQTMRVLQGLLWERGGRVSFSSGGEWSLCADCLAQSYLTKDFTLAIPCFGDRQTALAMDDELAVCFPASMMDSILEGLQNTQIASTYPIPFGGINSFPAFMPNPYLTKYAMEKKAKK